MEFNLERIREQMKNCPCGQVHEINIKEVVIGSGITKDVGEILKRNGFPKKVLFVADKNTLKASGNILQALSDFDLKLKIFDDLREATVQTVEEIEKLTSDCDSVIAVGTGSIHDVCRKASANADKMLCLYATAPSMDGFASYNAPLTNGNFKITYPAKTPEVIIADTKVLASAPIILKSAGFGDMVGKYVGLIDWQVSALVSNEYYCERVANLTRTATDTIMQLADRITKDDEESAGLVFSALLLTGIGMSFVKSSRPASGTEHILSHFWECKKLLEGERSDFHGRKVGVATLLIMEEYEKLYSKISIKAKKERIDLENAKKVYGQLFEEVLSLNTPDTITDSIEPKILEENWQKIREIIASVPSRNQIYQAMVKAGCPTTAKEIGVSQRLCEEGLEYHPLMRRRLSLRRLSNMIEK